MNSPADRRAVLRTAAGLALLPVLAPRVAQAADASGPFAPPSCDMIYRRTMVRQLRDGLSLTGTRDFSVRFSPTDEGYRIDGAQVASRVEAPASLAALARLEEQRVERGVFPLGLNRLGRIVDGRAMPGDLNVTEALEDVRQRFAGNGAEVAQLLDALSASSASITAYLPLDLFAPALEESEQRQQIALPWGQTGEVRVRFAASRSADTGLMRLATREVVTALEGEERRSAERWELFAA